MYMYIYMYLCVYTEYNIQYTTHIMEQMVKDVEASEKNKDDEERKKVKTKKTNKKNPSPLIGQLEINIRQTSIYLF